MLYPPNILPLEYLILQSSVDDGALPFDIKVPGTGDPVPSTAQKIAESAFSRLPEVGRYLFN